MKPRKNTARKITENGKTIVQLYFCEGKEARVENTIRLDDGTVVDTPFDDLDITLAGEAEMLIVSNLCKDGKHLPKMEVHTSKSKKYGAILEESRFEFVRFDQTPRYLAFNCFATNIIFVPKIPRDKRASDQGLCGMETDGLFSTSLLNMTTIFAEEKEKNTQRLEKRVNKMREKNASNSFAVVNGTGPTVV